MVWRRAVKGGQRAAGFRGRRKLAVPFEHAGEFKLPAEYFRPVNFLKSIATSVNHSPNIIASAFTAVLSPVFNYFRLPIDLIAFREIRLQAIAHEKFVD